MNAKALVWGVILLSFLWRCLAFPSCLRGKNRICLLQSVAGVAFFIRGASKCARPVRVSNGWDIHFSL